ncbi:MAG: hypothetical protein J6W79_02770, partial [Alphaproteobacteria bacterium]|nr:hypothetical protein [Alphaproteobacteria bacterium]
ELAGKYIVGRSTTILRALENCANKMPDAIKRKKNGKRTPFCLNINAIDSFCELSGLKRCNETISEKTPEWLGAHELTGKYIVGDHTKILRALEQYADQMPNAIQRKKIGNRTPICLNINAIDSFCKLSGLKRADKTIDKCVIGEKTPEWLMAHELAGKYIVGMSTIILRALEDWANKMPNAIQRKKIGNRTPICLNINAIDDFCNLSGLKRVDETISEKTSTWLVAKELAGKYIVGMPTKILRVLEQYADQMPDAIQQKKSRTQIAYCLNINAIDRFCELSGLKRKDVNGFQSGITKIHDETDNGTGPVSLFGQSDNTDGR